MGVQRRSFGRQFVWHCGDAGIYTVDFRVLYVDERMDFKKRKENKTKITRYAGFLCILFSNCVKYNRKQRK